MPTTDEILRLMLSQRGINADTQEVVESEFPAVVTKIADVIVFTSNRTRIHEKDVPTVVELTKQYGGTQGILVVPIPASEKVLQTVSAYSDVLQIFHVGQLTCDITKHRMVPAHRILKEEEVKGFLEKFGINLDTIAKTMTADHIEMTADKPLLPQIAMKHKEYMPMPLIGSQDPVARWIGARPGDIVEIIRKSESAGATPYYRVCVASV
jgi:DNA-directed RNA polymerase subunit H (RpoH/RPB5)